MLELDQSAKSDPVNAGERVHPHPPGNRPALCTTLQLDSKSQNITHIDLHLVGLQANHTKD